MRSWVYGRPYLKNGDWVATKPLVHRPGEGPSLSFFNLVEAFNLSAITRIDNIRLKKVRIALETLQEQFTSEHPLFDHVFWTEGINLYIKNEDGTYNVSIGGQKVFSEVIDLYLKRVVKSSLDLSPVKVYPFSREIKFDVLRQDPEKRHQLETATRHIEVDPLIAFGRPTITGTGVPVEVIASRRRAGDTVRFLAKDYDISQEQVREAIEYEKRPRKVA